MQKTKQSQKLKAEASNAIHNKQLLKAAVPLEEDLNERNAKKANSRVKITARTLQRDKRKHK